MDWFNLIACFFGGRNKTKEKYMATKKYVSVIFPALTAVLILMSFVSCDGSNSPEISEQSFKVSEHILQDYFITSITFDAKGTAWLGTFQKGLIKYENNEAVVYNSKNSNLPDSLSIYDVAVDNKNNIWLGCGSGLIKYDHTSFTLFNKANSGITENIVWSIGVDKDNSLWLASCRFLKGGLMKFNERNWTLFTPENSKLPAHVVQDIIVDYQNNKWISVSEYVNQASIIKITGNNWEIFDKDDMGFTPYYFNNLAADNHGNIYASLDYSLSSSFDVNRPNIIKYNGKTWTINNPVDENGNSLGYVMKIRLDKYGILWAAMDARVGINGSSKGFMLAAYDGNKWFRNGEDFPRTITLDLAIDKYNRKWLGTIEGVYIVN